MILLEEREKTHGDFKNTGACAEQLYSTFLHYSKLGSTKPPGHNEAIHQICTKLARIACGNPIADHYDDIVGYAELAKGLAVFEEKAPSPLADPEKILAKRGTKLTCNFCQYNKNSLICPECGTIAPR